MMMSFQNPLLLPFYEILVDHPSTRCAVAFVGSLKRLHLIIIPLRWVDERRKLRYVESLEEIDPTPVGFVLDSRGSISVSVWGHTALRMGRMHRPHFTFPRPPMHLFFCFALQVVTKKRVKLSKRFKCPFCANEDVVECKMVLLVEFGLRVS